MNIVFMGTPDFSVPTLTALAQGPHTITGVFCQPDKEKGRGKKLQMPPVKEAALALDLPLYQPNSLRNEDTKALLTSLQPDLIVVVAYGKILPTWLLELPKYGCINIHASILPKYRGAAPIHYAILNGDKSTGVTIMQMDEGLDTGDMLKTITTDIHRNETTGELFDRLATLGGDSINSVIEELVAGKLTPIKQDETQATYTQKITKEMGRIDWSDSGKCIVQKILALNPAPGCYTYIKGVRLKVWRGELADLDLCKQLALPSIVDSSQKNGTLVGIGKTGFVVKTKDAYILITEVQPENKKHMSARDFARGHQLTVGTQLGEV